MVVKDGIIGYGQRAAAGMEEDDIFAAVFLSTGREEFLCPAGESEE